jgi:hypothetical protein
MTLAGYSGPDIYEPITSPAEVYIQEPITKRIVNFKDFAIFALEWLQPALWP